MSSESMGAFLGVVVSGLVLALIGAVLIALPTMWLWNALLPDLFHFQEIGFWQAFGLNLLSSLLFKSSFNVTKS
jgi:succinate dehydrogenase hydrophobic anchor subunit